MPAQPAEVCNICTKDVSQEPAKHHQGQCPVCQGETGHVIPLRSFPWVCSEAHVNDASACAVCGREMPYIFRDAVVATLSSGLRKLICPVCVPPIENWFK